MSDQTTEAAEPTEPAATVTSGETTAECRECGAAIKRGAQFCPTCGTAQEPARAAVAMAGGDGAPASPTAVAATPATPAPTPASPTTPGMQSFLLPRFPFKLVWSPRKDWVVSTRLEERQVTTLFTETMTKQANLLRRSNNYYRRVSWTTQRNAISGEVVATCRASGPVTVGVGRSQIRANVSGDTFLCRVDRNEADGRNHVSVGVGTFTTWLGLYLFPPMVYSIDFVKALKRADPSVEVRHPWSVVRIVALVAFVIFLIAVSAGG